MEFFSSSDLNRHTVVLAQLGSFVAVFLFKA